MSLLLGKKLAEGGCSEVFEWEDNSKLIKLAKANTDYHAMSREYHNNRSAWAVGLPVAQPYEFLEINGRPGIVFERIYGETIHERLLKQVLTAGTGGTDAYEEDVRTTARILNEIHHKSDVTVQTSQKKDMEHAINRVDYLSLVEKEAVVSILDKLPSKQVLCHGDPNPGNIMIKNDGKAIMIDWMNASIGSPEADLAEYIIMMRYAVLPSYLPNRFAEIFDSIRESIINVFMDEYTKRSGMTYADVSPWITPVAARKLSADAISDDEKQQLLKEIRRNLNK